MKRHPRALAIGLILFSCLQSTAWGAVRQSGGRSPRSWTGSKVVDVQFLMPPASDGASQAESAPSEKTLNAAGLRPQRIEKAEDSIHRLFAAAGWTFLTDGTFQFTPPAQLDVRDDLYPLTGHYSRRQGIVEIRASRESPLGASVSVDGVIRETQTGGRLEAVYVVNSGLTTWVASVRQDLGPTPAVAEPSAEVGGVLVPSTFEVSLSARMDGNELPPQTARLKVLSPEPGSSDPCSIHFETATDSTAGSLHWLTPVSPAVSVGGSHRITVDHGQVAVEVQTPDEDLMAPFWVAPSAERLLGGLAVPFPMRKGQLTFRVQGKTVVGEVNATGTEMNDPARHARSYRGTFRGTRQVSAQLAKPSTARPSPTPALRPAWEFEVTLNGRTEAGSFENLAGLLMLLPSGQSGYEMGLTTSGEARNGWLRWSASIKGDALAKGEPVTVSLEPRDDPASQSAAGWFTISAEPGFQGMSVNVVPKKISLRLTIRAGKAVEGEIRGEGLAMAQSLTPSTYHASLRGKVKVNREEERLHKELSQFDFAGDFEVEDGSGGAHGGLSVSHDGTGLSGLFVTAGRALHLHGQHDGSRADFTEPGRPGSSLFLRVVARGESLVGLWREPGKGTLRPLVARPRRAEGSAPPSADTTAGDADTLRYLATDLARAGRCQAAREPLEQALAIYQRKGEPAGSDRMEVDSILISGYSTAQLLVDCDLSLHDYGHFVTDLLRVLTFLRSLSSPETARRAVRDQTGSLRQHLTSAASQVQAFTDHIHTLREKLRAGDSGSSAASALADAVGACEAELDSFRRLLVEEAGDVDGLATEVAAGKRPADQALSALAERRADLQRRARNALDRLAAIGREIPTREPGLLEERDRYWRLFAEASGARGPGVESLAQEEERLRAAITRSGQLGESEKEFVFQQAGAGIVLQAFERLLQIDSEGLVKLPAETYAEQLGDQAVQAAVALADRPEQWREWLVSDEAKGSALKRLQSFFGQLVLFLIEAGQKGDALTVAEIARSRALVDLLAGRPEVEAVIKAIPGAARGHVLPSPTATAPLSLAELLDVVRRRGSTTLEYFLTDEKLVILVVAPTGGVEVVSVLLEGRLSRQDLARSIQELKELLSPPGLPGAERPPAVDDGKRTAELLRNFHALLIAPIPARLLPDSVEEAVTIIPYGELFSVPFAALQDEKGRPLIEKHALVYGTSIAALKYAREDRERLAAGREPRLLAFVNPSPMPLGDDGNLLPPLEEVESRFGEIADFYPAPSRHVLTGAAATKATLFAKAGEATELYLVTHGKSYDKDRALDSYVAMAAGGSPEDGYLRVPEVFRLHLQADLVLLWACETGGGEASADGVQGLSRAFTWAGAPSLLLSLWTIPEKESLQQIFGFHQFWRKEGRSKAQALRLAQLGQMALYPDQPGVWAAFVLYGEKD